MATPHITQHSSPHDTSWECFSESSEIFLLNPGTGDDKHSIASAQFSGSLEPSRACWLSGTPVMTKFDSLCFASPLSRNSCYWEMMFACLSIFSCISVSLLFTRSSEVTIVCFSSFNYFATFDSCTSILVAITSSVWPAERIASINSSLLTLFSWFICILIKCISDFPVMVGARIQLEGDESRQLLDSYFNI